MKDEGENLLFCYFSLNNTTQVIVVGALTVLSLLLVGDAFRKYYRMRGSLNSSVKIIYVLVFAWWITYVIANVFAGGIYFLYKEGKDSTFMSNLTKYHFMADWVTAFLIQWLLLYLPYQWSKQISELFDPEKTARRSDVEFMDSGVYKGYQTRIYKSIKRYMKFRCLYFIALPFLLMSSDESTAIAFRILVSCLLVDCLMITFMLIAGMVSLKTTEQLREQLDEDETKRTMNQYLVVIIANSIRFGFDLFDIVRQVLNDKFFQKQCLNLNDEISPIHLSENIVPILLTFYLPIFIILRIYNLEERPELICQSLIISSQNCDTRGPETPTLK